ncbi:hypothetical protein [Nocardia shimofusensis]|uniref:hypothetical protein n=1 Tax=Nocardia shimofusensis TaxID=228596 RepID=UPI000835F28A|nr:hypothetical protein [Nocardia shimofusensis]
MPLEEVAVDLYGRVPADFVAARNERVAAATRAGDKRLAAAIGALRKPTLTAWAVNLLARRSPDEVSALLSLGEALRRAQRELSGEQLRALTTQRRHAVSALARRASELTAEQGKRLPENAIREVVQTLNAALADPDIAERVRAGTLATAATYSGFGPAGPDLVAVDGGANERPSRTRGGRTRSTDVEDDSARAGKETKNKPRARTSKKADSTDRNRQQTRVRGELARARGELDDLVETLESERAALASAHAEAERADRALLRCAAEIERLRAELAHAEQQRRFARTAQRSAQDDLDAARRQVERAERRVQRARERIGDLSDASR